MIAMIYRTAFPFIGEIAKTATRKMIELLSKAGISEDEKRKKHYYDLGWFLSVAERVSGYALGNFDRAMELARLNAHGLGWHPSIINRESVKYFGFLNGEKEMLDRILNSVSLEYKKNFLDNETWIKQIDSWKIVLNNLMHEFTDGIATNRYHGNIISKHNLPRQALNRWPEKEYIYGLLSLQRTIQNKKIHE